METIGQTGGIEQEKKEKQFQILPVLTFSDPLAEIARIPKMEKESPFTEIYYSIWGEIGEIEKRANRLRRKLLMAKLTSFARKKK